MKERVLTFRTMPPEWKDVTRWTAAEITELGPEACERFNRLEKGISLYLRTGKLCAAALEASCSRKVLIAQLNRCLYRTPDGSILGWGALIPGYRIKGYERHADLPRGKDAASSGSTGAFTRFLDEHPEIKRDLDDAASKGIGSGSIRTSKTTEKSIWQLFLRLVQEVVGEDEYPLNSASKARRSVERYARRIASTNAKSVPTWYGPDAAKALHVGNGRKSFQLAEMPFDMVGIDAHVMHCIGIIIVDGPAGPQRIPVRRIWIYVFVDFESRSILGYAVSIRAEPTAAQLEEAVAMAQKQWKRRELTLDGLTYADGAGFPCGCVEGIEACTPAAIRLDNAMQSYAKIVVQRIRLRFGCAISFSAVGAWWHNAITESVFLRLERCGFERLPSSTGSNANDPRRGDSVAAALHHNILITELIDIVDVALANYNATAQSGLGNQSPLDVLRERFNPRTALLESTVPVPPTATSPVLGVSAESRIVRGSRKPGKVRPCYVQIDGCTYTNEELAVHGDWINESLIVHIAESDPRTVQAYRNGQYIGDLHVRERGWQSKHSRDVRKAIIRLRNKAELSADSDDWVAAYLKYLDREAPREALQRPNRVNEAATKLADTLRSTGLDASVLEHPRRLRLVEPRPQALPPGIRRPSWS